MLLDLSSLQKSVDALAGAMIEVGNSQFMNELSSRQQTIVQAGVIQHFEFTYELCWKFMKRWLQENVGRVYVDGVSRRELFRIAAENRLIDDVDAWWAYHKARNLTSHIYNEEVADDVFAVSEEFLPQAQALLKALEARNDDEEN
ncbi:MAG TPA: nucleotidyltransferase [Chloroflexi bacterium]|nr:nucleotidyltransferase [Chloroflexota bacterium]